MVNQAEIRDDEPIPDREVGRSHNFPELLRLEPGQCAVFSERESSRVRMSASYITRSTGRRFVTRTVEELDVNGDEVRVFKVWRKDE